MHLVEFNFLSCVGMGKGAHCAAALTWELLSGMKRIALANLYAEITNIRLEMGWILAAIPVLASGDGSNVSHHVVLSLITSCFFLH